MRRGRGRWFLVFPWTTTSLFFTSFCYACRRVLIASHIDPLQPGIVLSTTKKKVLQKSRKTSESRFFHWLDSKPSIDLRKKVDKDGGVFFWLAKWPSASLVFTGTWDSWALSLRQSLRPIHLVTTRSNPVKPSNKKRQQKKNSIKNLPKTTETRCVKVESGHFILFFFLKHFSLFFLLLSFCCFSLADTYLPLLIPPLRYRECVPTFISSLKNQDRTVKVHLGIWVKVNTCLVEKNRPLPCENVL